MKTLHYAICLFTLIGGPSVAQLTANEPRSYASSPANPAGPPDAVASMIMRKPIYPIAIHAVAFSPDGRTVAGGDGTGRLRLWETATGKLSHEARVHSNWVFSVAWTKDGAGLLTGGGDNLIRWFDLADLKRPGRITLAHSNDVHAVALTGDAKTLVSAGDDRQIVIWDVERGVPRRRLSGHERQIPTVVLSPDEKLIASGSRDHSIRLWAADSGELRDTLVGHTGDIVALNFSPDGSRIASAGWDYTVRLWDVRTGRATRVLLGHPNWVSGVAFSPDGRRLASSSGFKLRVFDVASGKELWSSDFRGVIRGEAAENTPEDLSTVVFSPDGTLIAVGSTNGSVSLLAADSGTLLRQLGS